MAEKLFPTAAVIFAAGFGKRLQPLTLTCPKPLIPLGGLCALERHLQTIMALGLSTVYINTHHLASQIHKYLDSFKHRYPHMALHISHEEKILETGGGLKKIFSMGATEPLLCFNGDIWWGPYESSRTSAIQQMLSSWNPEIMDALLLVVAQENVLFGDHAGDFFLESLDMNLGVLVARGGHLKAPYLYTGIQLVSRKLGARREGNFSLGISYAEASQVKRLYGVVYEGPWCDMGTPQALSQLEAYLKDLPSI